MILIINKYKKNDIKTDVLRNHQYGFYFLYYLYYISGFDTWEKKSDF